MVPYLELKKAAEKWGDRTVFLTDQQKEISFSELLERSTKLAGALEKAGVGKGDVVAVLLPNCIELVELYIAAGALGAIFQPLDIRFRGEELKNAIAHTHTALLAVHGSNVEEAESALPEIGIKLLVHGQRDGWTAYEQFLAGGTAPSATPEVDEENDDAVYLFTSGSTDSIKCVPMTFRQLDYFPVDIVDVVGMGPDDRGISLLPFSHISGPIVINVVLRTGSSYVLTQRWIPDVLVDMFEKHRVTWTHTVPPLAGMVMKGNPAGRDLSAVRFIALMGTTVPASMQVAIEKLIPSCKCIQGYGLTETNPLITLQPLETHETKRGTIGKALEYIDVRVVDDAGNDVATGESGELIVRGPKVFRGYVGNPELTDEVFRNGWFHTGDVVTCDEDGYYFHLGRKDDVINTGGLKVYPAEIENALLRNPAIREVLAYGVPDEQRGNAVAAEVVPREGASLDPGDLRGFLLQQLADYKVPARIEIVEAIRRTPTGKPIRQPRA